MLPIHYERTFFLTYVDRDDIELKSMTFNLWRPSAISDDDWDQLLGYSK